MPFVRITHIRDQLSRAQQLDLVGKVQDAVVMVEGEAMRMGVGVVFEETIAAEELARNCAPVARITLVRDALSADQRAEMAQRVVEAIVAVVGEPRRAQVWVMIDEGVASGEWSIGGNALTLDALAAVKQGRNPWA